MFTPESVFSVRDIAFKTVPLCISSDFVFIKTHRHRTFKNQKSVVPSVQITQTKTPVLNF